MGRSESLTTNPIRAIEGARELELIQQQWADALQGMRPHVSIGSFGSGYGHFGAKIVGLATRAHDVRLAHANRLIEAARAGRDLISTIHWSDTDAAQGLNPVSERR